ncbi:LysM peptidoglycan-binding domain-containing protein [Paenibacillus montanisoli]|nr:LysM peptidoglycan-binding domain-containing protein [Paenibacillus montanisoli]
MQSKWVLSIAALLVLLLSCPNPLSAKEDNKSSISITYSIKSGDTLYSIAKKYYLTGDYERVARLNGWVPKASLKAGAVLKLKNPLILDHYTVNAGDTLFAITNRYFNRSQYKNALMEYNGISDPNTGLKIGMALIVPIPSGEQRHVVHAGDTLYSLSAKYFKSIDYQQAIARYNEIQETPGAIKAGQVLRIPNPFYVVLEDSPGKEVTIASALPSKPFSIEIDITKNKLYVRSGGKLAKSFDIASGKRKGQTPTGSFEIITKIKNPWYTAKDIPGGDPKNPLGSRWLGLNVPNTQGRTYGIHGTNAPASIGTNASAGCIRMLNKDVEWLYNTVPTGTIVKIHA